MSQGIIKIGNHHVVLSDTELSADDAVLGADIALTLNQHKKVGGQMVFHARKNRPPGQVPFQVGLGVAGMDSMRPLTHAELHEQIYRLEQKVKELEMANARSVLQDWVGELGLRQQGVLMSAVRGCDTAAKNDPSKLLSRCYRAVVLQSYSLHHEGKPPKSFIEILPIEEVAVRMNDFVRQWDQYPMHYVMHMVHAAQIVGFYHPDLQQAALWNAFYEVACHKLHIMPETREQLVRRLDSNEEKFEDQQREMVDLAAVARAVELSIPKPAPVKPRCSRCGSTVCNCRRFVGT